MKTQYILKYDDGKTFYYSDKTMTKYHRTDGPACEYSDGSKHWYVDGKRHRLDGPAVELTNGTKYWYVDGKLHRLDGPAIEWYNGTKSWYVDNKQLTEDEFIKRTKLNSTIEINGQRFTVEELNRLIASVK